MELLADYLAHIYLCDDVCLRSGFGTEVMFLTIGELSDAIYYAHMGDN